MSVTTLVDRGREGKNELEVFFVVIVPNAGVFNGEFPSEWKQAIMTVSYMNTWSHMDS